LSPSRKTNKVSADRSDGLGAIGICLLSFLSTFPIVIPFILIGDTRLALRLSNVVAIAMLLVCGYAFGRCAGFRPWVTGLSMVALGAALVVERLRKSEARGPD
jgi:VIT1/CCC1 family predicted Fe2+/Mn2+ transporter